jgi:hypothetical protein
MEQNYVENVMAGVSRIVYTKVTFVKFIHSILISDLYQGMLVKRRDPSDWIDRRMISLRG